MKIGIIGAGNIGEMIVLSIPFAKYPDLATLFDVPNDVAVIDTPNSYPFRDGAISEVVSGKPESVWLSEQIGRRSTKPGTPYWRRHSERAKLRPVAHKFSYSVVAKTTISILQCQARGGQHVSLRPKQMDLMRVQTRAVLQEPIQYCTAVLGEAPQRRKTIGDLLKHLKRKENVPMSD